MKITGILFLFSLLSNPVWSQPAGVTPPAMETENLPYMKVNAEKAQHFISWNSQYDGIRSIAVQRSTDSVRNFKTIGMINAPKKGRGHFLDEHPVAGNNYYRLSIEFGGDLEWFSNTYKLILDSATISKWEQERLKSGVSATMGNQNAQASASIKSDNAPTFSEPEKPAVFTFIPSSKIYTNPYTGHVNINLEDALSRRYSIRFFDPAKNEVLKVSRVSKTMLILDKNNFNSKGIYSFQLFDGTTLVESGYVSIY